MDSSYVRALAFSRAIFVSAERQATCRARQPHPDGTTCLSCWLELQLAMRFAELLPRNPKEGQAA